MDDYNEEAYNAGDYGNGDAYNARGYGNEEGGGDGNLFSAGVGTRDFLSMGPGRPHKVGTPHKVSLPQVI